MILVQFYQKFLPKYNILVSQAQRTVFLLIACSKFAPKNIHQIAWFQVQKFKIFQLLRGYIPPQTPHCTQARNWCWRATKSYPPMSKTDLRPW